MNKKQVIVELHQHNYILPIQIYYFAQMPFVQITHISGIRLFHYLFILSGAANTDS